ncbi:hypothetical protein HRbin39_00117 [bacterium HR39]|nr:hypothetical protein HRbin39_00117 [bacterium HR39]
MGGSRFFAAGLALLAGLVLALGHPLSYLVGAAVAFGLMRVLGDKEVRHVGVRLYLKNGVALVADADRAGPVYLRLEGAPLEVYGDVWEAPEEVQEAWERYLQLRALEEEAAR